MAGPRQTNTFVEAMQKLLTEIVKIKLIPDADVNFLDGIEKAIIARAKEAFLGGPEAVPGVAGAAGMGASSGMAGGAPAGGGLEALLGAGGAMPTMPGGPPAGVGGLPPEIPMEQLTRLMRGTA